MFGIFAHTNLSTSERAALLLYTVHLCLKKFSCSGAPMSERKIAACIDLWIKRNDRKASLRFRIRILIAANELADVIAASEGWTGIDQLYQLLTEALSAKPGVIPEVDQFRAVWLSECERVILREGLVP